MNIDRFVMAFAGFMVIVSLGLGWLVTPWFFLLTLLVGLNLFQAAFTAFCPLAMILKKIGIKAGASFT
jgi:hypothetical protein